MSFFKDVFNDFTRFNAEINTEAIRSQAKGFLIGGIGLLILFLVDALLIGDEIPLHVHYYPKSNISATEFSSAFGIISPNNEVILNYKPTTFIDAILFSSMGPLDIVDFLFFLYVSVLLFKTLRNVEEQSTFRQQISKMYKKIAVGCFWTWFFKMFYSGLLIDLLFYQRTNQQFSLVSAPAHSLPYIIYPFFGGIILSFVYFSGKGEALQQEQDLTI